ncbi:MAG: hypothetical protein JNM31_05765 [Flavobacteriales bacterium]|nr:hypothetical protein [Flavobacteriales bacterium]
MTFTDQLDHLTATLRQTRSRLLAPLDLNQYQLPRDPSIFVEDVLHFVLDQWATDLSREGHVLEHDEGWYDPATPYPLYRLRLAGGEMLHLRFQGEYPRELLLEISRNSPAVGAATEGKRALLELPITTEANLVLNGLLDGLKRWGRL